MTYDKETREELTKEEHMEDVIKEEKEREMINEKEDLANDEILEKL